ncbi:MAG: hypothetical protein Q4G47_05675 [Lachnospiraceae bacterium]|nr:hypothetical protein [Lachnospiraceae bacterium]
MEFAKIKGILVLAALAVCLALGSSVYADAEFENPDETESVQNDEEDAGEGEDDGSGDEGGYDGGEGEEDADGGEEEADDEDRNIESAAEASAADAFADMVNAESSAESTVTAQGAASKTLLWNYYFTYGGAENEYLETIFSWLGTYHQPKSVSYTGMIPAANIFWMDDSNRDNIRIYGQFLISDYAVSGTTLIAVADETITGCMHLSQVAENEYIVSTAESLDASDRYASARTLSGDDQYIMDGLLNGAISTEKRTQYIRDFVNAAGLPLDTWMDLEGYVHPLGENKEASPQWVTETVESQYTDQIVTVSAFDRWNATVSLHERNEEGGWDCVLSVPGLIGREGLGKTCEGDMRTPVGVFGFTEAFGLGPDPGCRLSYTQCDDTYWWVGDSSSSYYNKLVSTADGMDFDGEKSERIADKQTAYRYGISLSYNEKGTPFKGSAIFLHAMGRNSFYTGGCISVPFDAMTTLITRIKPTAKIIIDSADIIAVQHLRAETKARLDGILAPENTEAGGDDEGEDAVFVLPGAEG